MPEKMFFINLDFFPPSAERLFELPSIIEENGGQDVYLKMICNFPWEFEPRMRAESFYPDNVTEHFFKLCSAAGMKITFLFPGPNDLERLLRLPGYSRLSFRDAEVLRVNPDSIGLKSFFESVIEDVVSLVPNVGSFAILNLLNVDEDFGCEGKYNKLASDCISSCGYEFEQIEPAVSWIYSEELFAQADRSSIPQLVKALWNDIEEFEESVFRIKQYSAMSGLCCNAPAAGRWNTVELYSRLKQSRGRLDESIDALRDENCSVIDRSWLEKYLSSIKITADEDASNSEMRLKLLGLLRHT